MSFQCCDLKIYYYDGHPGGNSVIMDNNISNMNIYFTREKKVLLKCHHLMEHFCNLIRVDSDVTFCEWMRVSFLFYECTLNHSRGRINIQLRIGMAFEKRGGLYCNLTRTAIKWMLRGDVSEVLDGWMEEYQDTPASRLRWTGAVIGRAHMVNNWWLMVLCLTGCSLDRRGEGGGGGRRLWLEYSGGFLHDIPYGMFSKNGWWTLIGWWISGGKSVVL